MPLFRPPYCRICKGARRTQTSCEALGRSRDLHVFRRCCSSWRTAEDSFAVFTPEMTHYLVYTTAAVPLGGMRPQRAEDVSCRDSSHRTRDIDPPA